MECIQCGATVVAGQNVCEACGASIRQGGAVVPQEEIAGLLAEATLLRTWGQYEEAINVCIRIVRLDARNFAAHSLLGDLCRDQSNHRDALSWYKLAVQLEPGNEIVRRKLDEMIDHVFQGATRNSESTPVVINSAEQGQHATPAASRQSQRLQQILNKVQPAHMVLGCTVLAIAFMLLVMLRTTDHSGTSNTHTATHTPPSHFSSTGEPLNAPGSNGQPTQGAQPPVVTPPPADPVESGGTANSAGTIPGLPGIIVRPKANDQDTSTQTPATTQPAQPDGNTPPAFNHEVPPYQVPATLAPQGSDDQHTSAIRGAMEHAAKDPRMPFTLDKLSVDPRSANITVEYSVPNVGGLTETKKGLLYAGYRLIWSAMSLSPATQVYTLRGNAYADGSRQTSLAMTADITPTQAEQARSANDYVTASSYLNNPWWRADLANAPL